MNSRGVTLVELMVTVMILAVAGIGLVGTFSYISRASQLHRTKTLATNLDQEQVELLKNKNYFEVIPTSVPSYNNSFTPPLPYDNGLYPPSTARVGNMTFQRLTYVERVMASGGGLVAVPPDSLDTGLKRITITTIWKVGGRWYKSALSNLLASSQYSNTGGIGGTVTDASSGQPIEGADVYATGDLLFHDFTGADGTYVMSATPGNFTLRAQAPGYFKSAPTAAVSVTNGNVSQMNIQLTRMGSGRVSGAVWVNNQIVISQVVGSTVQAGSGFDVQYVELYNPTTYAMFIGGASSHTIGINFATKSQFNCLDIPLTYVQSSVASDRYYLIANTKTFTVNGVAVTADAFYSNTNADGSMNSPSCNGGGIGMCTGAGIYRAPCAGHSGVVSLSDAGGNTIDAAGWTNGASGPVGCAGNCFPLSGGGLPRGDQLVRMTSTGTAVAGVGNAYNSDENDLNFVYKSPLSISAHNAAITAVPVSGTPAVGAVVTCNDGLSASTVAWLASSNGFHYATYTLVGIATGTWMVEISSGSSYLGISNAKVLTNNASTGVPNGATSPAWQVAGMSAALLTGTTTNGIVSGQVTDPNGVPLSNVTVSVQGETNGFTNAAGYYNISVPANTYSVTANPNSVNANYSNQQLSGVVVNPGTIANGNNFVISGAGRVNGYVCNYANANPYPGVTVTALDGNGNSVAQVVTGSNGKFIINNLSTGTYNFSLVLDPDQSNTATALGLCSQAGGAISCQVAAGSNVAVGTFTIAGAYGTISGNATFNGSPITTGVLVVATTATIVGTNPPDISTAILMTTPYYMASSASDGSYSFSVRASTASDTFNLYGWYTTFNGTTPVVTKKWTTVNVVGGQTATKNLAW
jgi:type II secretory pathway pseudopilin PulG